MSTTSEISFDFVVGNTPEQLKGHKIRVVRSHVSKVGWKARVRSKDTKPQQKRLPRRKPEKVADICQHEAAAPPAKRTVTLISQAPPGDWQLGGGRLDPFCAYPGERRAYIPALIDHYIVHMAVDIPELDQPGNKGLLRSSWFPLVISNLVIFQTIMLLSASNAASIEPNAYSKRHVLELKSDAISSMNKCIVHDKDWASDALIGATAKMAGFEAMHGNLESYRMHMAGLCQMLELRGGLNALGLGGLLRRIVVWIDLNSAFLLKVPRYFPRHYFKGEVDISEPDPESFLAP